MMTEISNIPLYSSGIISSTGLTWIATTGGTAYLELVYSSSTETYEDAIGVLSGDTSYTINRTYLNFDTSIFSGYTNVLSSVKLLLTNYHKYLENVQVMIGTQNNNLTISDWGNFNLIPITGSSVNYGSITELILPLSTLQLTGRTKLVLLSYSDYNNIAPISMISSFSGIDFGKTTLEVIYEPIKVYGQTELNVQKGDNFTLYGYVNSGTSINIEWYKDSGYTELISIGQSMTGYSMEYQMNKIYAVLPILISPYYSEPLIITINIIELNYSTLPIKYINYDEIDIDSIYFKYHKCLSGVCYTYVRDINDAYEGSLLVSDSTGNESYNLYNEFDVIDEFFSNSHEVEVAYNTNLDLTKRYNNLDGVILREGTRVLLMAQTNVDELGVYVVNYDNTLIRTDEMNTYDDLFRYKAHVGAGTYFDQEVHVWPILPPLDDSFIDISPNPITFNYQSGDSMTISITSNINWVINNIVPWVTTSVSNGSGNLIITLVTTMNNLTGIIRTGTIEFIGDNNIISVLTVYQDIEVVGEDLRILTGGDFRSLADTDDRIVI